MLSKLVNLEKEIKNEKLRQSIKTDILNCIVCLKNYITFSPGVISPGKTEDKIKEIRGYIKVWIKNASLVDKIDKTITEFEYRYLEISPNPPEEKEVTELINIPDERPKTLPNYVRKLLNEVDPIKGDVSYLPIGPCSHYCIVYKISGDVTYVIPLTTTLDVFSGYEISKSRFYKGMAIYTLHQFPTSLVKEKLTIPYDHKGELRNIFKSVEEEFRSIFPKTTKRLKRKPLKSL